MVKQDMRVLVYCANGYQGRAIVRALRTSGNLVRALVRDQTQATPLVALGAEVAVASFEEPESLGQAHRGVDAVVMQFPSGEAPRATKAQCAAALQAIHDAGIGRAVLNTSVLFPRRVDQLPQMAVKQEVERTIRASSLQLSVIQAPFLLSNLLLPWASGSIAQQGVLPYPIAGDQPLSWAAPEDIGRLATLVLARDLFGLTLVAGARKAVRGDELAAAFSSALQRTIRYLALPLDAFEAGVDAAIGEGVGKRVGAIFRFVEAYPDDRDFVTAPFSVPADFPNFEPMTAYDWVAAHLDAFTHMARVET